MGNRQSEITSTGPKSLSLASLTYRLFRSEPRREWIESLRGSTEPQAIAALIDLIEESRAEWATLQAIELLGEVPGSISDAVLSETLNSTMPEVRRAAIIALRKRQTDGLAREWHRLLRDDPHWQVRREALTALADEPIPLCWGVLTARDDPEQRVRQTLDSIVRRWADDSVLRTDLLQRLQTFEPQDRGIQRIRAAISSNRFAERSERFDDVPYSAAKTRCPFWDDDPAVLSQTLREMTETEREKYLDQMPFLLGHPDEPVRVIPQQTLAERGTPSHLAECLPLLDDPRHPAMPSGRKLIDSLSPEIREELAFELLHRSKLTPAQLAFAIDQVTPPPGLTSTANTSSAAWETAPALESLYRRWGSHSSPIVRSALVRLLGRWPHPAAVTSLIAFLDDADPRVQEAALLQLLHRNVKIPEKTLGFLLTAPDASLRRASVRALAVQGGPTDYWTDLLHDPSSTVLVELAWVVRLRSETHPKLLIRLQASTFPAVRVAAMTHERAKVILDSPASEPSWRVLARAASMHQVPIWNLAPTQ